ncbi:reverse transcriptase domain, Reverse transcriptase zinc-binding domain protein [Artemisia annua]|uniref:Reverse transcriptase domain, Reverse transcriptase zinc-binding domain protein n=1 Tax=Artemisia annua TaxID=35608 RepID=A0A2U1KRY5_ARTAN|nr:reverse transcriptase domain, Reverse transcriptase zinc-binding domain protein [Artemisia annua]
MVWSNDVNLKCPLCKQCHDSHSHLFFQCNYSKTVWASMRKKLKESTEPNEWSDVVSSYATKWTNNSIDSVVGRLVLGVSVYFIWQERNKRLSNNEMRSEQVLIECIMETIKLRIMSLRALKTNKVLKVAREWGVDPIYVNKDGTRTCAGKD